MLQKTLAALAAGVIAAHAANISGAGASFPAPVYFDWAYLYQKETGNQVNYQSIGSGGGIKQISARTIDFGASDKPLKPKRLDKKRLYQFPAVIGSIVAAYNIPGLKDGQLKLENKDLAAIFMGKIKYWDDKAITEDNPGVKLPHKEIVVSDFRDAAAALRSGVDQCELANGVAIPYHELHIFTVELQILRNRTDDGMTENPTILSDRRITVDSCALSYRRSISDLRF